MRDLLHPVARIILLTALVSLLGACAAEESEARPGRLAIPAPSAATSPVEEDKAVDLAIAPVSPAGAPGASAGTSTPEAAVGVESTSPAPTVVPVPEGGSVTVYVTKTGAKYHRGSCQHLSKSKIPMDLEVAKKRYGPCGTCKPPR